MPAIYALYIINKSGGLIYNKVGEMSEQVFTAGKLLGVVAFERLGMTLQEFVVMASNNLNDTLRLASIWYAVVLLPRLQACCMLRCSMHAVALIHMASQPDT